MIWELALLLPPVARFFAGLFLVLVIAGGSAVFTWCATSPGARASGTTPASTPQSDRMGQALARASHAPLRESDRLTPLRDRTGTYDE